MADDNIVEFLREKTQIEEHCQFILSLFKNYSWEEKRKLEIISKVNQILNRKNDDKLYLAIVGEFSSGKTTLINFLLQKDLLKTHSVQGTTIIPGYIEYAEQTDLAVELKDGTILKYRKDKEKLNNLLHTSQRKEEEKDYTDSSIENGFMSIPADENSDNEIAFLAKALTTRYHHAKTIEKLTLYLPSPILKKRIVIIDTPGTDSLEKDHLVLTEKIIKDKCDLSLVVIPAEKQASITLLNFLRDYVTDNLHRCLFLITKVELLRSDDDRKKVCESVAQKLSHDLGLNNVKVIAAPTLLMLEEMKITEESGLLDDLGSKAKAVMAENFNLAIHGIFESLGKQKIMILSEKLIILIDTLFASLEKDLEQFEEDYTRANEELKKNRIVDLDNFIRTRKADFHLQAEADKAVVIALIKEEIDKEQKKAFGHFGDMIRAAGSKEGIHNAINKTDAGIYLKESLNRITKILEGQTSSILEKIEKNYKNFGEEFSLKYENLAALKGSISDAPERMRKSFFSDYSNNINLGFETDKLTKMLLLTLEQKFPFEKAVAAIDEFLGTSMQESMMNAKEQAKKSLPMFKTYMSEKWEKGKQIATKKVPLLETFLKDENSDINDIRIDTIIKNGEEIESYYSTVREDIKKEILKKGDDASMLLNKDIDNYKTAYENLVKEMMARDEEKNILLGEMRMSVLRDQHSLKNRAENLRKLKELYKTIK